VEEVVGDSEGWSVLREEKRGGEGRKEEVSFVSSSLLLFSPERPLEPCTYIYI